MDGTRSRPEDPARPAMLDADQVDQVDQVERTERTERTEWTDAATGYRCLVMLSSFKMWAAFVEVPPDHPLFEVPTFLHVEPTEENPVGIDANPDPRVQWIEDLRVQGGVTFVGLPAGADGGTWWIGFDPGRRLDHVKEQCADLAGQLADVAAHGAWLRRQGSPSPRAETIQGPESAPA